MSATIISRLAAPLCYNFLGMTRVSNASFLEVRGVAEFIDHGHHAACSYFWRHFCHILPTCAYFPRHNQCFQCIW